MPLIGVALRELCAREEAEVEDGVTRGRVGIVTLDVDCRTREVSEMALIGVALREPCDIAREETETEDGVACGRVGVVALDAAW